MFVLTETHMKILENIDNEYMTYYTRIARETGIPYYKVYKLTEELRKDRYVKRLANEDEKIRSRVYRKAPGYAISRNIDKSNVLIHLTKKGKKTLNTYRKTNQIVYDESNQVLTQLPPDSKS